MVRVAESVYRYFDQQRFAGYTDIHSVLIAAIIVPFHQKRLSSGSVFHLGLKAYNSSIFGNFENKNTEGFVNMEWKGGLTVEQDIKIITQLCPHLEKVIVVWFARMWSCKSLRHR